MIRPIVQLGDPVLKAKARRLDAKEIANETTQTLVRDMLETLEDSGGVGLAAPQVGVSVALILAGSFPTEHSPDRPEVEVTALVNPRIVWSSVETESAWEGCLSFLDYRVQVVRPWRSRSNTTPSTGRPSGSRPRDSSPASSNTKSTISKGSSRSTELHLPRISSGWSRILLRE